MHTEILTQEKEDTILIRTHHHQEKEDMILIRTHHHQEKVDMIQIWTHHHQGEEDMIQIRTHHHQGKEGTNQIRTHHHQGKEDMIQIQTHHHPEKVDMIQIRTHHHQGKEGTNQIRTHHHKEKEDRNKVAIWNTLPKQIVKKLAKHCQVKRLDYHLQKIWKEKLIYWGVKNMKPLNRYLFLLCYLLMLKSSDQIKSSRMQTKSRPRVYFLSPVRICYNRHKKSPVISQANPWKQTEESRPTSLLSNLIKIKDKTHKPKSILIQPIICRLRFSVTLYIQFSSSRFACV